MREREISAYGCWCVCCTKIIKSRRLGFKQWTAPTQNKKTTRGRRRRSSGEQQPNAALEKQGYRVGKKTCFLKMFCILPSILRFGQNLNNWSSIFLNISCRREKREQNKNQYFDAPCTSRAGNLRISH